MYLIAATYGHGRRLFYAGPADVENASRAGVQTFSLNPDDATAFARWPDAMRASWRASSPRRRDRWLLERLEIEDVEAMAAYRVRPPKWGAAARFYIAAFCFLAG